MTRREAVRVLLFARANLIGADGAVRCAVVDLSAAGAQVTVKAQRLPRAPLRLEFELGGESFVLAAEIRRASAREQVALEFVAPPTDRLHRLIADEQRRALAAGRRNVRERRSRRPHAVRHELAAEQTEQTEQTEREQSRAGE